MVKLLLVRHGETDWNVQKRYQGQMDIPLNTRGAAQAQALAQRLANESVQAIYASDLARALATAEAIAAPHGLSPTLEPRLREMCFGAWEGLTYTEIEACDPERLKAWRNEPCGTAPPGGETADDVRRRVERLLDELVCAHTQHTLVLAAHGGCLQVLLCLALGLPPSKRWAFRLDPASLSVLDLYPEGGILSLLNDRHHLDEALH